jgi:hypothetical protein
MALPYDHVNLHHRVDIDGGDEVTYSYFDACLLPVLSIRRLDILVNLEGERSCSVGSLSDKGRLALAPEGLGALLEICGLRNQRNPTVLEFHELFQGGIERAIEHALGHG